MRHARFLALGLGLVLVACAANSGDLFDSAKNAPGSNEERGQDGGVSTGAAAPNGDAFGASASGVFLVHAAVFPAFRLCFGNAPNERPQPDNNIMPNANVIGVEVGSVIRIPPLQAPGQVTVIRESALRNLDPSITCGDYLEGKVEGSDYFKGGTLEESLGDGRVHVLALTGCGSQAFVNAANATASECNLASTRTYEGTYGNLELRPILIQPANRATTNTLPIQVVNLAPAVPAQYPQSSIEISFGDLGSKPTPVALTQGVPTPGLLKSGDQLALSFVQNNEAVYATQGFRLTVKNKTETLISFDQSLAQIQDFSAPNEVPTTYFKVASNYAFLLVGDPKATRTLDGGTDNRRRLQLLALPVLDPATLADAGAGGADGGDAGAK